MSAVLDIDQIAAPLASVPRWFEAWEQALSRFRADSELSELNRRSGQWARLSPILWEVIQLGLRAAQWTDGIVTPAILNAVEAAGYDRTFEAIQSADRSVTLQPAGVPADLWRSIERHTSTRSIYLPPNARIDLGGVAKGWAAERAARKLTPYAPALIDAGGDIAISGPRADGEPWPIGVSNPFQPDQHLEILKLSQGGVATSGRDYRRWQKDGVWQHHIIDPRTCLPARTDVISATVIAPTTYEAEVAAKVILIAGSAAGLEWIEALPDFAALIMLEDGRVLHSTRLSDYSWR